MKTIDIIDSHTGGEPTRLVIAGGPDLGGGTLAQRLDTFRTRHDDWRRAITPQVAAALYRRGYLDRSPVRVGDHSFWSYQVTAEGERALKAST